MPLHAHAVYSKIACAARSLYVTARGGKGAGLFGTELTPEGVTAACSQGLAKKFREMELTLVLAFPSLAATT